jgi:hypothetical protein
MNLEPTGDTTTEGLGAEPHRSKGDLTISIAGEFLLDCGEILLAVVRAAAFRLLLSNAATNACLAQVEGAIGNQDGLAPDSDRRDNARRDICFEADGARPPHVDPLSYVPDAGPLGRSLTLDQ